MNLGGIPEQKLYDVRSWTCEMHQFCNGKWQIVYIYILKIIVGISILEFWWTINNFKMISFQSLGTL